MRRGIASFRFLVAAGCMLAGSALVVGSLSVARPEYQADGDVHPLRPVPSPAELIEAAKAGDSRRMEALLARGAPVNASDARGQTALMHAAAQGFTRSVATLLARGADARSVDHSGATALTHAVVARYGCVRSRSVDEARGLEPRSDLQATAELLLDAEADPNSRYEVRRWNSRVLHLAAAWADVEMVRLLLDHGAAVNVRNRDHRTPLQEARHLIGKPMFHYVSPGRRRAVIRLLEQAQHREHPPTGRGDETTAPV